MNAAFDDQSIQKRHGKAGLISFGLAIFTGLVVFLLFAISLIPESGTYNDRRLTNIFFIFALVAAPTLHFGGLLLGVAGALTGSSKKVFPILGIVFNTLPLVAAATVWILLFWVVWAVLWSGGGWH